MKSKLATGVSNVHVTRISKANKENPIPGIVYIHAKGMNWQAKFNHNQITSTYASKLAEKALDEECLSSFHLGQGITINLEPYKDYNFPNKTIR